MAPRFLLPHAYPCPLCPAHFVSKKEQATHFSKHHDFETPWICHECPTSYPNQTRLETHIRNLHPASSVRTGHRCCHRDCGPPLPSAEMASRHSQLDHAEQAGLRTRRCLHCDYTNNSYIGISIYVLHVHPPVCQACGRFFSNEEELAAHKLETQTGCIAALLMKKRPTLPILSRPIHDTLQPASVNSELETTASNARPNTQARYVTTDSLFPHPINHPRVASEPFNEQIDRQMLLQSRTVRKASIQPPIDHNKDPRTGDPSENTQPNKLTLQSLGLPASIFQYGFDPKDFDLQTKYANSFASRERFKPFPPDLAEKHIFNADPKQICYGNLLRIATKHSDTEIVRKVNEGRPEKVLNSAQTLESRIRSALEWKAATEKASGGVEAVRNSFARERAKNGVVVYRRNKTGNGEECPKTTNTAFPPPFASNHELRGTLPAAGIRPKEVQSRALEQTAAYAASSRSLQSAPYPMAILPGANHSQQRGTQ